ncbi:tetratricopeptide repeat protein [Sphingomonas sp. MAH-20]|uniref:Tetratricopeptide repeat protein n=1 Tax=Sphingomonas horti TaxID=2682842 RepID=A0A6I4IWN2_9SPHN|nr:tetratricopeptide repeat protein [Sphingomonas sp. CGMCC 1.13658]MBA2920253.1 tetratricopeptide repeat protein [Sphingomonas sp. CGMCC 1.13658]MVO76507.1 tetratricopeptide repeat protein [Sphingomonas horti]
MDRITPICSLSLAVALLAASGAEAKKVTAIDSGSLLQAYARARLAGSEGALDMAASAYSAVLTARPDDAAIAARAYRQAIVGGEFPLALKAAAALDKAGALPADGQLLYLSRALKAKDWPAADAALVALGKDGSFDFVIPVLRAWVAQASGQGDPFAILDAPTGSALTSALASEQRALILVASGKLDEAATVAQAQALASGGGSAALKLTVASALQAAGRHDTALMLLRGDEPEIAAARDLLRAGKPLKVGSLDAAGGIANLFVRVGEAIQSDPRSAVGLTLARLAHYLDPSNDGATVMLARLLANVGQSDRALELAAAIGPDSPWSGAAIDTRVGILTVLDRRDEALALAQAKSIGPGATLADMVRVGDLLEALERHAEAAQAYDRAIALGEKSPDMADKLWSVWLLKGSALEQGGDWAAAKPALEKAVQLAPLQPVALNYLGYAQLERRENVKAAMALIERASQLKPDDPAITDSLGWAHYLIGDVASAIPTLEKAVQGQPGDATMNEHLGDAYWAAGRKYEARYAWNAAAVLADNADVAARAKAKAEGGFTPALAAR